MKYFKTFEQISGIYPKTKEIIDQFVLFLKDEGFREKHGVEEYKIQRDGFNTYFVVEDGMHIFTDTGSFVIRIFEEKLIVWYPGYDEQGHKRSLYIETYLDLQKFFNETQKKCKIFRLFYDFIYTCNQESIGVLFPIVSIDKAWDNIQVRNRYNFLKPHLLYEYRGDLVVSLDKKTEIIKNQYLKDLFYIASTFLEISDSLKEYIKSNRHETLERQYELVQHYFRGATKMKKFGF